MFPSVDEVESEPLVVHDPTRCEHGILAVCCGDARCLGPRVDLRLDPGARLALQVQVAGEVAGVLSRTEVLDVVEAAEKQIRWLSGLRTRMLAEFTDRHPDGSVTAPPGADQSAAVPSQRWVPDEVGLTLGVSRLEALGEIEQATRFAHVLPDTLAELEAGRIDMRRAEAIARATAVLPDDKARSVEARVLPRAHDATLRQVRDRVRRAIARVDPDGQYRRHKEADRGRRVSIRALEDGMASLWFYGSAAEIEAAWQVADRLARSLAKEDPRTLDQRRFDLSMQILQARLTVTDRTDLDTAVTDLLAQQDTDNTAPDETDTDNAEDADTEDADTEDADTEDAEKMSAEKVSAEKVSASSAGAENADAADPADPADADDPTDADDADRGDAGDRDAGDRDAGDRDAGDRDAGDRDAGDRDDTAGAHTGGAHTGGAHTGGADPAGRADRGGASRDRPPPGSHTPTDALTAAVAEALSRRPDLRGVGRKPLVQVVVGIDTLMGSARPAELVGHGPIDADTARALAADSVIVRLLTDDATGTLLEHGRTHYTPPAALADHVRSRDQTCRGPRCTRRVRDLDHHHDWALGGNTDHTNLHGLCHHCHQLKDAPGWHCITDPTAPNGDVIWISPCGRTTTSSPYDYRDLTDDLPDPIGHRSADSGPRPDRDDDAGPDDTPPPF